MTVVVVNVKSKTDMHIKQKTLEMRGKRGGYTVREMFGGEHF